MWLKSIVRQDLWLPGKRFESYSDIFHKHNTAPEVQSKSGIYAFKNINEAIDNIERTCYRGKFLGKVYLWGVIHKHHFGYRAQFAYPHSLTHGICCICRKIVSLLKEPFAIGWAAYHFSESFSVSGFLCKTCNEKYYGINTDVSFMELSILIQRYRICIE